MPSQLSRREVMVAWTTVVMDLRYTVEEGHQALLENWTWGVREGVSCFSKETGSKWQR